MQIRCDKCSTLYNFDESLLPAEGAPVQCTKCQHVFTAFRPQAPSAAVERPAAQSDRSGTLMFHAVDAPLPAADDERDEGSAANPTPSSAAPTAAAPPPEAPALHAPDPAPAPAPTPPVDRRYSTLTGTTAIEERLVGRKKVATAIVGAVVAALLVIVVAALFSSGPSFDEAAIAKVDEAYALNLRADPKSIEAAVALADEALTLEPAFRRAQGEKAFALLLGFIERQDRIDRIDSQRPRLESAVAKARKAKKRKTERRNLTALDRLGTEREAEIAALAKERAALEALLDESFDREGQKELSVLRAQALYLARKSDVTSVNKILELYRKHAGEQDGWAELIEGQLAVSGLPSPESRRSAIEAFGRALEKDPKLQLARLLLCRSRLALDDLTGARLVLDEVLAQVPGHTIALRLDEELSSAEKRAKQAG